MQYHVKEILYLAFKEGNDEYEQDPFATTTSFTDAKEANAYRIQRMNELKEQGGRLSVVYEAKQPKKPSSMDDEEWDLVQWIKQWTGDMDEGETFIKGFKLNGISFYDEETQCETYITITQTN